MQSLTCDLWLMERNALRQFFAIVPSLRPTEEQARAAAAATPRMQKKIAVLPITGVLEARATFLGEMLGMTSYQQVGKVFDSLINDESVSAIVLDVASPGGMVYGAQELADKMYVARGKKPIVAVANPMAASAAYWLACAADRVVASPSADVGSVGVVCEHVDMTLAHERDGAKVTVMRSSQSPYKQETNDAEPLTDEAKAHLQQRVDMLYGKFAGDLARFRGVSVEHVNAHFGQGRLVDSASAMKAGMIDRVDTLDGVVSKLAEGRIRIGSERSQDVWDGPTRRELLLERVSAIERMAGEVA